MDEYTRTMKDMYEMSARYQQSSISSGPTMYVPPPSFQGQQYQNMPPSQQTQQQDDGQPWPWKQKQQTAKSQWGQQEMSQDWSQHQFPPQQQMPGRPTTMFEMVGRQDYQDPNRIPGLEDSAYQPAMYSNIIPKREEAPLSDAMLRAIQKELGAQGNLGKRNDSRKQQKSQQQQQPQNRQQQMKNLRQLQLQKQQEGDSKRGPGSLRPKPMDTTSRAASFSSAHTQDNMYSLMGYPNPAPSVYSLDGSAEDKKKTRRGGKKNNKKNYKEEDSYPGGYIDSGLDKYGYMAQAESVYNQRQGDANKPGSWKWVNPDANSGQRDKRSGAGSNQRDRLPSGDDDQFYIGDNRRMRSSRDQAYQNQQIRGYGWPRGQYMAQEDKDEDKVINLMDIPMSKRIAQQVKEKLDREKEMKEEMDSMAEVFKKQSVMIVDQPAKNKPVQIKLQMNKDKIKGGDDGTDWTKCDLCNIVISGNSEEAYRNHCRGIVHLQKIVDKEIEHKKKGYTPALEMKDTKKTDAEQKKQNEKKFMSYRHLSERHDFIELSGKCDICNVPIVNFETYLQHIEGSKHAHEAYAYFYKCYKDNNLPKKYLFLEPTMTGFYKTVPPTKGHICQICETAINGPKNYGMHVDGKNHVKKKEFYSEEYVRAIRNGNIDKYKAEAKVEMKKAELEKIEANSVIDYGHQSVLSKMKAGDTFATASESSMVQPQLSDVSSLDLSSMLTQMSGGDQSLHAMQTLLLQHTLNQLQQQQQLQLQQQEQQKLLQEQQEKKRQENMLKEHSMSIPTLGMPVPVPAPVPPPQPMSLQMHQESSALESSAQFTKREDTKMFTGRFRENRDKLPSKKYAVDYLMEAMEGKQDPFAEKDKEKSRQKGPRMPSPRRRRSLSRSRSTSPRRRPARSKVSPGRTTPELPERYWYDCKLISSDMLKYKSCPPNLNNDSYLDWFYERYGVEKFLRPDVMTKEVFAVWNWRQFRRFELFMDEYYKYNRLFPNNPKVNYDSYFDLYFDSYFEKYYADKEVEYEHMFEIEQAERLREVERKERERNRSKSPPHRRGNSGRDRSVSPIRGRGDMDRQRRRSRSFERGRRSRSLSRERYRGERETMRTGNQSYKDTSRERNVPRHGNLQNQDLRHLITESSDRKRSNTSRDGNKESTGEPLKKDPRIDDNRKRDGKGTGHGSTQQSSSRMRQTRDKQGGQQSHNTSRDRQSNAEYNLNEKDGDDSFSDFDEFNDDNTRQNTETDSRENQSSGGNSMNQGETGNTWKDFSNKFIEKTAQEKEVGPKEARINQNRDRLRRQGFGSDFQSPAQVKTEQKSQQSRKGKESSGDRDKGTDQGKSSRSSSRLDEPNSRRRGSSSTSRDSRSKDILPVKPRADSSKIETVSSDRRKVPQPRDKLNEKELTDRTQYQQGPVVKKERFQQRENPNNDADYRFGKNDNLNDQRRMSDASRHTGPRKMADMERGGYFEDKAPIDKPQKNQQQNQMPCNVQHEIGRGGRYDRDHREPPSHGAGGDRGGHSGGGGRDHTDGGYSGGKGHGAGGSHGAGGGGARGGGAHGAGGGGAHGAGGHGAGGSEVHSGGVDGGSHGSGGGDDIQQNPNVQLVQALQNPEQLALQLQPLLSTPQGAILTDVIQMLSSLPPDVVSAMASCDPQVIAEMSNRLDPGVISALNQLDNIGMGMLPPGLNLPGMLPQDVPLQGAPLPHGVPPDIAQQMMAQQMMAQQDPLMLPHGILPHGMPPHSVPPQVQPEIQGGMPPVFFNQEPMMHQQRPNPHHAPHQGPYMGHQDPNQRPFMY